MRLILVCLSALLVLIQYPLWLGKGGWLRVWDLDKQVQQARQKNAELKARNAKLQSEVDDLKQGMGSVEERARYELGMIKQNEVFIYVLAASVAGAQTAPSSTVYGNAASPASSAPASAKRSSPSSSPSASSPSSASR